MKKINDNLPNGRKLFIYSGHEFNIAHLLRTLGAFQPEIPNYASYVLVELHKVNGTYGFQVSSIFQLINLHSLKNINP